VPPTPPASDADALDLRITPRAAELTIVADPALPRVYEVRWEGPEPTVREDPEWVEIGYGLGGRLKAMAPRGGSLTVTLNPAIAWAIHLRGGVSGMRADLSALRLTTLTVTGGASDIAIDLPRPQTPTVLRVEGGVSGATIRRPADVPVAVEIDGGATDLRVDDVHLGAVGGAPRVRSAGAPDGDLDLMVRVLGGASGLTVGGAAR
jgi:hypothetical protein